ncbi:glycosyltransferase [Actinoalloteichus hymeniacidonis]|uniref:Glycosyl transferase, UDP-glucuronosyltransferase n=1 Tax=Actinoalloteichus hymeniacidonis TaxID=340345 RepID=A0AAC9HSV9_9PSEU|nr:glycosyltransferase [Actinoalloteichus hymeniacidonis]AOS64719.1 glycosyl transferase, UDP-glucuronosyltransferase [Actinoalloteichus hymeniacidonis]MBB5907205.1 UDP:flavonoid glycosyltransferase YjiC (YdhE family) [Actinoalloteichus hymeniacidonis]
MRMLFSAVSAYGHILPLAPLMQAAVDAGHDVALLTSEGVRPLAANELAAEVELLGVCAEAEDHIAEAARRSGGDPFHPTPEVIGEVFGNTRLILDAENGLSAASTWAPDLIVAELFDTVGPMIAARMELPWYQVGIGPALPAVLAGEIDRSVLPHYERAGVKPVPAAGYLDTCPAALQDPEWVSEIPVLPVRVGAHRRPNPSGIELPRFTDPSKPTVLLTLGTVFSEASTLAALCSAVAQADVNVLATLGVVLEESPEVTGRGEVRFVPFAPLEELLKDVTLVVAAGGSGTVLGTLSRGIPLVLWPQGADQPINAARAAAAGVALVAGSADETSEAVARALQDEQLHTRAAQVAADNELRPTPAEIVATLTAGSR